MDKKKDTTFRNSSNGCENNKYYSKLPLENKSKTNQERMNHDQTLASTLTNKNMYLFGDNDTRSLRSLAVDLL